MTSTQTVFATAGFPELTWPLTVTEKTGKNITTDTALIGLSTAYTTLPESWSAPTVKSNPTVSSVTVQLLIDNTIAPDTYYVWVKVTDSPEVVPRRGHRIKVV